MVISNVGVRQIIQKTLEKSEARPEAGGMQRFRSLANLQMDMPRPEPTAPCIAVT
jgi:hypothetical protein